MSAAIAIESLASALMLWRAQPLVVRASLLRWGILERAADGGTGGGAAFTSLLPQPVSVSEMIVALVAVSR